MASLFDLDNSSDSEEDIDYEPPADEISTDEEDPLPSSDDEKESKKKCKNRQRSSKSLLSSDKKVTEECKLIPNAVDEKKKAEDIYQSFLDEVAAEMKESKPESVSSGISCSGSTTSSSGVLNSDNSPCLSTADNTPEKLYEFAGETIAVINDTVKSVNSDSLPNNSLPKVENATATPVAPVAVAPVPTKKRGLESVLGTIQNKKQKITVMQKSLMDWKSFKKEEGLDHELAQFNRGKQGFVERQRFLQRSDLRSYEVERDMRLSKRPTQAKRDT